MRALVVYESMFGNTQAIARAIADGIASRLDVGLVEVGAAPAKVPDDVSLLVAGGPTHAFGLSRDSTRKSASEQAKGPLVSRGIGLREWLDALSAGHAAVAAFDTRVRHPRVPGSAAHKAEKRLRRLGFRVAEPAETFWVDGTTGPLLDGEADRAREWGARLAASVGAAAGVR
ncbi:MAG TPA: flavodoxin family protein [Frankiaceae bacterium]|nr:flavodoxin family protein [Frankiaceae bacterium]